ncbi:hypothetical protein H7U12_16970 [Rufibacter sp. H-1]|uniref:TonB-dependent receptor plug domain-containing protein n=2 Tax=Rufibacter sediminis TaxID=2762756 RepID=A0ABR6VWU1_9BACT|nr:hypothetical protein [Rufibacter sediminis]MBC3541389.1 hypothetical protein [Rufibacter sediminis]
MTKHLSLFILFLIVLTGCNPNARKLASNSSPLDAFKGKKPLIFLNGRPTPQDSLKHYVNQEDVESVELVENSKENNDYLIMTYGEAAKDGVIKVTTNSQKAKLKQQLFNSLLDRLKAYEQAPSTYLFVKDGFLVVEEEIAKLKNLHPSDLVDVVVLKEEAAKAIYGSAAKENTVLINTNRTSKN